MKLHWRDGDLDRSAWLQHGAAPPVARLVGVTSSVETLAGQPFHVIGARLGEASGPLPRGVQEALGSVPVVPEDRPPLGEGPPLDFDDHHVEPLVGSGVRSPAAVAAGPGGAGSEVPLRVQRCGVYAIVIADGHILLSRLTGRRQWTLPGGGIDLGEHPEVALQRELAEETGLALLAAEPVELRTAHWVGRAPHGRLEDFHAVRLIYRGVVEAGEPRVVEVDGTSEAATWMSRQEFAQVAVTPSLAELRQDLTDHWWGST